LTRESSNANLFLKPKQFVSTGKHLLQEDETKMGEKMDRQHMDELKEMIKEKKSKEPVEKVFVKFCARHGVSLDTCRIYYNRLVEKGEVKEK
jgi:ribosomal protein L20A (L18A)